jgi:hypothetical protein
MATAQDLSEVLRQHVLAVPGPNKCAIVLDAERLEAELLALLGEARTEAAVVARATAPAKRRRRPSASRATTGGLSRR